MMLIRNLVRPFWKPFRKWAVGMRQKSEGIYYKDPYFWMNQNPAYSRYMVGRFSYGTPEVVDDKMGGKLIVGSFCSIADGVRIILGCNHRTDWITTFPFTVFFEEGKHISGHTSTHGDVVIGSDVWIGTGAIILSGVTLGDGCVVGAGAVVSRSVPPYGVVAGNPARLIRHRFTPEEVDKLLNIRWWDWPLPEIRRKIPLLVQDQVSHFFEGINQ